MNVRQIQEKQHLPDYEVELQSGDMVVFSSRKALAKLEESRSEVPLALSPEVIHDAKQVAPGWDIYLLEQKWRAWMAEGGMEPPRDAGKAFVGFCKRFCERNGSPR